MPILKLCSIAPKHLNIGVFLITNSIEERFIGANLVIIKKSIQILVSGIRKVIYVSFILWGKGRKTKYSG